MMIGEVLAKNKYICLLTSPLFHDFTSIYGMYWPNISGKLPEYRYNRDGHIFEILHVFPYDSTFYPFQRCNE